MRVFLSSVLVLSLIAVSIVWAKDEPSKEAGVSGIVFFKTRKLEALTKFYVDQVGCKLWLDQGGCRIFRFGNMLFGFCQRDEAEPGGLLTFFYESREDVDRQYRRFKSVATAAPKDNPKYKIYHFYAQDPEGREIEFQYFLNPIEWDFKKVWR